MAIVPPLDEEISTWLRNAVGAKFAEHYEALRDKVVELDAGGGAAGTAWEAKTVAGSDVTDFDITTIDGVAVNGQTDNGYEIIGYPIAASSTPLLTLQPNAVSANQNGVRSEITANAVAGDGYVSSARTDILVGIASSAFTRNLFHVRMPVSKAATGYTRWVFSDYGWISGVWQHASAKSEWNDVATSITSLRIHSSVASAIKVGSVFWIRRMGIPF